MSQTVITFAFEQWKAQEAANGHKVVLDEFVLAYVPGLDHTVPIDRNETLPPVAQIVHRQAVNKVGLVNDNAVVYSVTMGTNLGNFDFNWIGLVNQATGTVAMIVHAPTQSKVANEDGQQGNVLTRSFLMEYNGAATETGITTPAETWQIDFTARLGGIDEMQRLINLDHYGRGAFFADAYLVAKNGSQYFVTAGTGYIGGLRAVMPNNQNIIASGLPTKVWVDVSYQGNVVSQWETAVKITVAKDNADYTSDTGFKHYVFAVASIAADGTITDLRPKGSLGDQQFSDALKKHEQSRNHPDGTLEEKGFVQLSNEITSDNEKMAATPKAVKLVNDNASKRLSKESNLSDLVDKSQSRVNLNVYGKDEVYNKNEVYSTLAANNQFLQRSNNGSDIPNPALFRAALSLASAALRNVGNTAGTIPSMDYFEFVGSTVEGYIKLPNGARIHWQETGNVAAGGSDFGYWTYPFPSYCLFAIAVPRGYYVNDKAGGIAVGEFSNIAVRLFNWGPITTPARLIGIGL
ncbi:hypothetical protein C9426_09890 [Serratia sp. S1B]|nr:hypothetical protein C9426_09890 [Serratia sp. S1B]